MSKNIDALLKEVVRSKIDNTITPSKEEVWSEVKVGLRQKRKTRPFRYKPIVAVCIAFIILVVSLAVFYTPVKAFTIKIIKSIEEVTGDTFIIHKIIGADLHADIDSIQSKSDDPRIDEARREVSFEVLIPSYIPVDYELHTVDIFNINIERESVTLLYANTKDKKNKECFEIVINSFSAGVESQMNYVLGDDTKIEYLDIDGIERILLNYEEFYNVLLWDEGNLSYKIDGSISKEDIIKIAKSME